MRRQHIKRISLATLALALPCIALASSLADSVNASLVTIVTMLLTVLVLGGSFAATRNLRRELERQAGDYERERSFRIQVEHRLHTTEAEWDERLDTKQSELEKAHQQLALVKTRLDAAETRLTRLARIDDLTGVANRRRFDEALEEEIKRMVRDQHPLAVIVCEVDFLDDFLAIRGRDRCSDALAKVARALDLTFRRAGDLVARYGSAKFGIILPATDQKAAMLFADRLVERVWGLCIVHDKSQVADRMTMSAGVAIIAPNKLHRMEDVLETAETALERARKCGHNRAEFAPLD